MRIGFITGEYPPMQGGVGAYTRALSRELVRQGHEISILTDVRAASDNDAIRVQNSVKKWSFSTLTHILQWAMDERLDLLHLQYQTAAFAMSPFIHFIPNYMRHHPVITTFHDLRYPYLFPKAGALRQGIVRHLANTSALQIVTNHEDAASLPNAHLIPIGSNIDATLPPHFDRHAWRMNTPADAFVIAFFGFINESKGIDTLIDSLAQLRAENIPAHLLIIGGRTGTSDPTNATYADQIDAQIARLEMQPFVHFTGFVDDTEAAAYLAAADCVALPFRDGASYRRGSLMAAFAHHCATITTTPKIAIDTFKHNDNLYLVPPENSAALADALRECYQSPTLRQRLSTGASQLADLFQWQSIAAAHSALYQQFATDSITME